MCSENLSFIETDIFYATTLHIFTGIGVPVHLFGVYIIVARTPSKMSSVKLSMFLLLFAGAFMELFLSFFAIPVLTLPSCAIYTLGFGQVIGVPTEVQAYIGYSVVGVTGITILVFFEERYHQLVNGHRSNGIRSCSRVIYIVIHYMYSAAYIIPVFLNILNQTMAKLAIKKAIPCIPLKILSRPDFSVISINNFTLCFCIVTFFSIVGFQVFLLVSAICWKLFHMVSQSEATNRLQKQFFYALCLQVFIPVFVLTFPMIYVVLTSWFEYYNQAATNTALTIISTHGILSTLTMLIVHTPYRKAATEILCFNCKKAEKNANNSQQIWRTVNK
ncbi:Serpentine Receptor, class H [Caenorhabditis elegans]|uniref:Serpentine Receptor, class H n=1 Tax=Caenorhabditis elegans TaxID=6239 RepID=Q9XU91_CAEEL|nr:Serpentine Receptor, class H [Caenorhabditis elegans]CAB05532.1 Serpentine Receptor, class H [Caenorhabditis elegans]|eukprot:NP_507123.1 Serpentine Receptor, class H [Caenorhabditis elegans]